MERDLGTATAYTPPQTQQTQLPDTLTIQGRNFSVSHLLNLENVDFSDPNSLDQVHSAAAVAAAQQQHHHHHHDHQVPPITSRDGVLSDSAQDDGELDAADEPIYFGIVCFCFVLFCFLPCT